MLRIRVSKFMPFESRQGSYVYKLQTSIYDAEYVRRLKHLLRELKWEACDPDRNIYQAGGWLAEHRAWFVEPVIWPQVRKQLEYFGYSLHETGESAGEFLPNWARVLGVKPPTTLEAVKARFRQLALIYHPDRGGSDEQFIKIKEAYEMAESALLAEY